ncbi:MAG: hypothetical protein IJ257_00420, partial [Treponema sp.]|nr:hypothetical protein [Treponema sp.]
ICLIQISFDFSKVIFLLFSDNCMYNSNREGKSFFVNSRISIFSLKKHPSVGVRLTIVLNRKNGFAVGKIGAKVVVA